MSVSDSVRLTPAQRSMRARIAANSRWSREDGRPNALRAQAGLLAKFADQVDPDHVLSEDERMRRAVNARRAHMQRLAYASSKARTRRTSEDAGAA
jgi:hypothetical protein